MKSVNVDELLITTTGVDRRGFLKRAGLTGLGAAGLAVAGTALLDNSSTEAGAQTGGLSSTDIAILQFALNLEYLEAEFYTKATTGKTISQIGIAVSGMGTSGPTLGGQEVSFGDSTITKVAKEIAEDEQQHVQLLRAALGSNVIAKPEINLDALGHVSTTAQFLAEARAFEDVGVSAYGGAAPLIQSKQILSVAARIALTEGEHTGNLRLLVALHNVMTSPVDSQDIVPPPSGTQYFSNNSQGLTIVRTPSQVLAIVYGSHTSGTSKGGFFPQGVNGAIKTV
jgi:rubrerythrin